MGAAGFLGVALQLGQGIAPGIAERPPGRALPGLAEQGRGLGSLFPGVLHGRAGLFVKNLVEIVH